MQTYRQTFTSTGDALAVASRPDATEAWSNAVRGYRASRKTGDDRARFTGTANYDEAAHLAAHGDPKAAKAIDAIRNRLTATVASRIQRLDVVYDVQGESIDVGAYCAGAPDPWLHWETTDVAGPQTRFVRILANMTVSAGIGTDVIRMRGAALAALAECLELSGTARVAVEVAQCATGGYGDNGRRYVATVNVKPFDAPLEVDRIAFWLAHPSALRRIGFALYEQIEDADTCRAIGSGYGMPCDLTDEEKGEDCIYLPAATYGEAQWESADAAAAWVMERLQEQGVTLTND